MSPGPESTRADWRKSTYSGDGPANCVEVADLGNIGIRDSKAPETGHLEVTLASFRRFVATVKAGHVDLAVD